MHVLALVDSPQHVCCRYRITAFQSALEQAGHHLDVCSLPRNLFCRLRILSAEPQRVDVVILQRKLLPRWQLSILRRHSKTLLFDFDDAVFLRDSYSTKGLHDSRRLQRFLATIKSVDGVIAGNSWLAQRVQIFSPSTSTTVIPTCVNPASYPVANHTSSENTELTWIGSSSTIQGLEQIASTLESIGETCENAHLKLICDRTLALKKLPVHLCPWSEETEASELAKADVGISWIPEDDWSRGKCGLKILQYFAAGLPVVANPVGVHPEMVRHGETGFLAETPEQWQKCIRRLLLDPELRQRMGQMARRCVEARYSVRVGAMSWLSVLQRFQHNVRIAA